MILQVQHIEKSLRRKKVLQDVSMHIRKGELVGITGENGSGKSTLLKIIIGQWKADKGIIQKSGNIGYCPQELMLFNYLTAQENLEYFSHAYGLSKGRYLQSISSLMQRFKYAEYGQTLVSELSGGTKQKLNLSIALLHNPSLLILDEPYNGFDWETYLVFWNYVDQLRSKGCSLLVVSHLIAEQSRFDRILHLEKGSFR